MLVQSAYFKVSCEKRKWPLQDGYWSYKIAMYAHGGHSHEELIYSYEVLKRYGELLNFGKFIGHKVFPPGIYDYCMANKCGVCFSSSERDGGVRFLLYEDVVGKHPEHWDVLDVTDDMDKAMTMLLFCIDQNGKKYDWPGVLGFRISLLDEDPEKWYCSEICDKAKELVGLWPEFYRSHPSESYRLQKFLVVSKPSLPP